MCSSMSLGYLPVESLPLSRSRCERIGGRIKEKRVGEIGESGEVYHPPWPEISITPFMLTDWE